MEFRDIATLVGFVTGPLGFGLALLVYFRDRAKVLVRLVWNWQIVGGDGKKLGRVTVGNLGRRPIYLSHVHFRFSGAGEGRTDALMLPLDGVEGVTLKEGDAPRAIFFTQDDFQKYAALWPRARATVIDAAGRHYHSEWPESKPAWAEGGPDAAWSVRINKLLNRLRRWRG